MTLVHYPVNRSETGVDRRLDVRPLGVTGRGLLPLLPQLAVERHACVRRLECGPAVLAEREAAASGRGHVDLALTECLLHGGRVELVRLVVRHVPFDVVPGAHAPVSTGRSRSRRRDDRPCP